MKRKHTLEKFQKLPNAICSRALQPGIAQKDQFWYRHIPFLIDSSFRYVAKANLFTMCNFLELSVLLKEDYLHKSLWCDLFRVYH